MITIPNCLITQIRADRLREYSDYRDEFNNSFSIITKENIAPLLDIAADKFIKIRIEIE